MQQTPSLFLRFPVMASFVAVFTTIVSITLTAPLISLLLTKTVAGEVSRILITFLLLLLAVKTKITPFYLIRWNSWDLKKCILASLPMLCVAALNWIFIQWDLLQFSFASAMEWGLSALASGFFEEGMMRAVVFLLLWRAWQNHKNGLIYAAVIQAGLFGLLHLLNLGTIPTGALFAQIVYAIFLGFGFAGLLAYTRSLWPAVAVHAIINLFGSMNSAFVPGYEETAQPTVIYIGLCIVIFFLAALPGWKCLNNSSVEIDRPQ